jgi:hypothetical protein
MANEDMDVCEDGDGTKSHLWQRLSDLSER